MSGGNLRRKLMRELRELTDLREALGRLVKPVESKGMLDVVERRRADVERRLLELRRREEE